MTTSAMARKTRRVCGVKNTSDDGSLAVVGISEFYGVAACSFNASQTWARAWSAGAWECGLRVGSRPLPGLQGRLLTGMWPACTGRRRGPVRCGNGIMFVPNPRPRPRARSRPTRPRTAPVKGKAPPFGGAPLVLPRIPKDSSNLRIRWP
jgi:hypothetical protein